jgi:hypothetical protein
MPSIANEPHQFRTRNDPHEAQRTWSNSKKSAGKSTKLISIPPLITMWSGVFYTVIQVVPELDLCQGNNPAPDFPLLSIHRSAFNYVQIYDRYVSDLPLLDCMQHLAVMRHAKTRDVFHRRSRCVSPRELDPDLVKIVEALAVADARRDHLFENERLMKTHTDAASEKRISGGDQDEARGSLCSVLDRASERKVD